VTTSPVLLARHARDDGTAEDDSRLREALRLATNLVAQVQAFVLELDLGDLDLPSITTSPGDQARLRAVAPLYLASELESARLLPALEIYAGVWASGGIPTDLGAMGATVTRVHRQRSSRLAPAEREAIFGRLFGKPYGPDLAVEAPRNTAFDGLMAEFAASLSDWQANVGQWGGSAADAARVRSAAQRLAGNLASRSGGIAAFAAGEILEDIKLAVSIFKDAAVQRSLGTLSMWQAVRTVIQRFLQQDVDVSSHVERARAGLALLAWLADALPPLESGVAERPDEEVVMQAIRWMQATLALHERAQPAGAGYGGG
jgi:hypothetical protein